MVSFDGATRSADDAVRLRTSEDDGVAASAEEISEVAEESVEDDIDGFSKPSPRKRPPRPRPGLGAASPADSENPFHESLEDDEESSTPRAGALVFFLGRDRLRFSAGPRRTTSFSRSPRARRRRGPPAGFLVDISRRSRFRGVGTRILFRAARPERTRAFEKKPDGASARNDDVVAARTPQTRRYSEEFHDHSSARTSPRLGPTSPPPAPPRLASSILSPPAAAPPAPSRDDPRHRSFDEEILEVDDAEAALNSYHTQSVRSHAPSMWRVKKVRGLLTC